MFKGKRLFTLILTLALILGMFPASFTASAAAVQTPSTYTIGVYNYGIDIQDTAYIHQNNGATLGNAPWGGDETTWRHISGDSFIIYKITMPSNANITTIDGFDNGGGIMDYSCDLQNWVPFTYNSNVYTPTGNSLIGASGQNIDVYIRLRAQTGIEFVYGMISINITAFGEERMRSEIISTSFDFASEESPFRRSDRLYEVSDENQGFTFLNTLARSVVGTGYLVYKFDFMDAATDFSFVSWSTGAIKASVSKDNENYTTVFDQTVDPGGHTFCAAGQATQILENNPQKIVYLKIESNDLESEAVIGNIVFNTVLPTQEEVLPGKQLIGVYNYENTVDTDTITFGGNETYSKIHQNNGSVLGGNVFWDSPEQTWRHIPDGSSIIYQVLLPTNATISRVQTFGGGNGVVEFSSNLTDWTGSTFVATGTDPENNFYPENQNFFSPTGQKAYVYIRVSPQTGSGEFVYGRFYVEWSPFGEERGLQEIITTSYINPYSDRLYDAGADFLDFEENLLIRKISGSDEIIYRFDFADSAQSFMLDSFSKGSIKASISNDLQVWTTTFSITASPFACNVLVPANTWIFENNPKKIVYVKVASSDGDPAFLLNTQYYITTSAQEPESPKLLKLKPSSDLIMDDTYIYRVSGISNADELKANFEGAENIEITGLGGTGSQVKLVIDSQTVDTKTVVIMGDLNGDIAADALDVEIIKNVLLKNGTLSGAQEIAINLDKTSGGSILNLLLLKDYIVKGTAVPQDFSEKVTLSRTQINDGLTSSTAFAAASFLSSLPGESGITYDDDTLYYFDFKAAITKGRSTGVSSTIIRDTMDLIYTIQGIVNRDAPRLFINYAENTGGPDDEWRFRSGRMYSKPDKFWFDYVREDGKLLADKNVVTITSVGKIAELFSGFIAGAAVWDENVYATSHVASTVSGVENLVPIRYSTGEGLYDFYIRKQNMFRIKRNLTGIFTGSDIIPETNRESTGSTKNDAYIWALENYLKTGKTNDSLMTYSIDAWPEPTGGYQTSRLLEMNNRDYYIQNKAFFLDLSVWDNRIPADDPTQVMGTDYNTLCEILTAQNLQANGKVSTVCGFVPFVNKYSNNNPDGSLNEVDNVLTEHRSTDIFSSHYIQFDADPYTSISNASLYSNIEPEPYTQNVNKTPSVTLENKTYIMFYMGDYDGAGMFASSIPGLWNDPARGQIPLAWGINSVTAQRVPQVFEYMYETKSASDYFVMGDNGSGYLNPAQLVNPSRPQTLNGSISSWVTHNQTQAAKFDLTVGGFTILKNSEATTSLLQSLMQFSPHGLCLSDTANDKIVSGASVYSMSATYGEDRDNNFMRTHTDSLCNDNPIKPQFIVLRMIWRTPSEVKMLYDSLKLFSSSKQYEAVDPYTFNQLYLAANQ